MALSRLGSSIHDAMRKVLRAPSVDEKVVKELCNDIVRALLQADVNVQLVIGLSKRVEERALREKVPPGITRKEHVVKVVYEEMTNLLGSKAAAQPRVTPGKLNTMMFVGIQGSGKTTSAVKVGRYFQKRGFKVGLICADTYRPGAYAQLKQLAEPVNLPVYGEPDSRDALSVVKKGLQRFKDEKYELVIIDTAGRHKSETELMEEMKKLAELIRPDEIVLTVDGTIGQAAQAQAKAFHEATSIGSILVTKLDGTARGGGALSAVAATGAPIRFVGVGEKVDDLEPFVPTRFVGRLLGMGDLQGLLERAEEAEIEVSEKKARSLLAGKLTLKDMYEQMEAVRKMGPLRQVLSMLPGLSYKVPDEFMETAETKLDKWKVIIQSMTEEEREEPKVLNQSRVRRIARGAGVNEGDVKDMIKQYEAMKKMLKSLRGRRLPMIRGLPPMKR
ncbi:MAG: signal recognition particle protein Srp54 [Candidatus Bathyarchaeia archaeon]